MFRILKGGAATNLFRLLLRCERNASDDFPAEAKVAATWDLNDALQAGWAGFEIGERIPLAEIARAHELAEHPVRRGRIVVTV